VRQPRYGENTAHINPVKISLAGGANMTYEQAIKALGLTTGWRLVPFMGGGEFMAIRNELGQCPIEALAQTQGFSAAVKALGMRPRDAVRLASAADGAIAPFTGMDRHELLVACGLESTEQV